MGEVIWTNSLFKKEGGRKESLVVVMKAMIEGKTFDDEKKQAINKMWLKILKGEKKLADLQCLIDGVEPLPEEMPPEPEPEVKKVENEELFI